MSKDERGYNGWTNKATWLVAVWFTNDYLDAIARGRLRFDSERQLAAHLREYAEELVDGDTQEGTLGRELATSRLAEVDWEDIAEAGPELGLIEEEDEEEEARQLHNPLGYR
jgi:hypothetical protein